jgi:tRNA pseudouridine55 synthase
MYCREIGTHYDRGMKKLQRTFDGLVNLHKPAGISSSRALERFRGITGVRKSGHSGTLDPLASGVLVICMGRGTKLVERLMDQPKRYIAVARLDVTSASHDTESELEPVPSARQPSETEMMAAMGEFEGTIQQAPPAFSAVKINGRAASKFARGTKAVEMKPRWRSTGSRCGAMPGPSWSSSCAVAAERMSVR